MPGFFLYFYACPSNLAFLNVELPLSPAVRSNHFLFSVSPFPSSAGTRDGRGRWGEGGKVGHSPMRISLFPVLVFFFPLAGQCNKVVLDSGPRSDSLSGRGAGEGVGRPISGCTDEALRAHAHEPLTFRVARC